MKYNKIFEVSEDKERIYFSFFSDNNTAKIIGIPKQDCLDKTIYAGMSFDSLMPVEALQAKLVITELMKRVLLTHPYGKLCDKEKFGLILGLGS